MNTTDGFPLLRQARECQRLRVGLIASGLLNIALGIALGCVCVALAYERGINKGATGSKMGRMEVGTLNMGLTVDESGRLLKGYAAK